MRQTPTVEQALEMTLIDFRESIPTREQLDALPAIELVRVMDRLHKLQDELKTLSSPVNELYDALRFSALPRAMETEGLESFVVSGVGRVSLTADLRVSIPAPSKEAAYNWLHEQGSGDLITETINAQTLAALARKRLKDGKPLPAELFKCTPFTRATITKA